MATVRVIISNRNLLEHASCRSMACMLNAGGAKLCNFANMISGATMAGRFSGAWLKDLESIDPENTICYVLPQGDEYPTHRHRLKILGYPLSRSSCPRETQLVVKLLNGLLSELVKRRMLYGEMIRSDRSDPKRELVSKVCISCSVTLAI
jgi:hypothetical protein